MSRKVSQWQHLCELNNQGVPLHCTFCTTHFRARSLSPYNAYHESEQVSGTTIKCLCLIIPMHLTNKIVNNHDFLQHLSTSHQHVSSWYQSRAINAASKPEVQYACQNHNEQEEYFGK